jgi:DNA-3-methyladenine glycosylase
VRFPDQIPLDRLIAGTEPVPEDFYARPATQVARDSIGLILIHGQTAGRIVETEAYLGTSDPAAHGYGGITERSRVLYGPPGRAYIYFIYGMYECLNFVAETDGVAGGVLIRALEPLSGLRLMARRRPTVRSIEDLASGPGKLTIAMGITRKQNGLSLTAGPIQVRRTPSAPALEIAVGPRIGIRHAADWPLRFFLQGSRYVSR